jgi:TPR repeat protein
MRLAEMHWDGRAGEGGRDEEHAVACWRRAAEAGVAEAQYSMGTTCADGAGGQAADMGAAKRWWRLAADQGFEPAVEVLRRVGSDD